MRFRLSLLALVLTVAACDSSDTRPETAAVYVGNQGTFGSGTGSITEYDPAASTASASDIVTGGLVQKLEVRGGRLYVLLNFNDSFSTGNGRIDVIDLETGEGEREIAVGTPRDWAVVDGTAYVSNYYSQTVTPVYLATGQTGEPIPVGGSPEGVAAVGNRVHVVNSGSNTVTVVSALNNAFVQTIDLDCDVPRAALADDDGEVWVVCNGGTQYDENWNVVGQSDGEVVVIDGNSAAIVDRIPLDAPAGTASLGQDAAISRANDEVYVVQGASLLRFDTRSNALVGTIPVSGEAEIGAVAYDDGADRLYLGRLNTASPYAADGFVTVHDRTGAEVSRFDAGVIPASIALLEE